MEEEEVQEHLCILKEYVRFCGSLVISTPQSRDKNHVECFLVIRKMILISQ